jgi:hypothetical protein
MPELVRNDAGGDADCRDNIGKVRTQLLNKGLLVARSGQEPAVERERIKRAEEAKAMYECADEGVHRDHPLGLQLAKRNVNGPLIGADIMEAIIGKIGAFSYAHSGMAHEQQDVGG